MKTNIYFNTALLCIITLASCKSVDKLYQKGDYEKAVFTGVKKSKKDKLSTESKTTFANAYTKAVTENEDAIQQLKQTNNELKWETIAKHYNTLQSLYNAILKSENALQIVAPINYATELYNANANAAQVRVTRGNAYMDYATKANAKLAYYEYITAQYYDNNSTQIESFKQQALALAITNIVIAPIQTNQYYYTYNNTLNQLENELQNNLQHNNNNMFVKYYTNYTAYTNNIRVDNKIELWYHGIEKNQDYTNNTVVNMQKENVLISETIIRPDSIVRVYGTVQAKYTELQTTQNYIASIKLLVQDAFSNQYIDNKNLQANYNFTNTTATYTGDKRALTTNQITQINNTTNRNVDTNQMQTQLTTELSNQIVLALQYSFR